MKLCFTDITSKDDYWDLWDEITYKMERYELSSKL